MSRLPHSQIEPSNPIKFDQVAAERRRCPRRLMEEIVTAVYSHGAERLGLARMVLIDSSHTGLGLLASTQLDEGTRVTLTSNNMPMPHKSGVVVRCIRLADGFSIGIALDRPKAAA
jgi:hypothetical protein